MKNSRYFPFERNRYFYGKLLTVRDFETEQKYVNDKRRLLNRLLYGAGVVSGLQVVAVDDKSLSVEMGVAIDSLGREIVVASPVTLKLSTIDGFSNNEYAKNVYLCIAYDEKGKEPVHSVANSTGSTEDVSEYNRISETYKLVVKEEAPDPSTFHINHLVETTTLIYDDGKVRIWQTAPKYINPGETFEVNVKIEKTIQTPQIFLQFEIESDCFSIVADSPSSKITFSEPNDAHETSYEFKYLLQAKKQVKQSKEDITLKGDRTVLKIGEKQVDIGTECSNTVEIIEGSVKEKIIDSYFEQSLEQSIATSSEQVIYLAKISLIQMGSTYMIEKINQVPFAEYVFNPTILYKIDQATQKASSKAFLAKSTTTVLNKDEEPYMWVDYNQEKNLFDFNLGIPKQNDFSDEVSSGTVTIDIEDQTKQGKSKGIFTKNENRYFSEEIAHGLGNGSIYIHVGLEEKREPNIISDILDTDEKIFYGDLSVFNNSEYETEIERISIGTIVFPKRKTFRIGIKTEGIVDTTQVTVRWWAFKVKEGNE